MSFPNYDNMVELTGVMSERNYTRNTLQNLDQTNSSRAVKDYYKMLYISNMLYNMIKSLIVHYLPIAAEKGLSKLVSWDYHDVFKIKGFMVDKLLNSTDTYSTMEFNGTSSVIPPTRVPIITQIINDMDARYTINIVQINELKRIIIEWE
jgi:hypothetical protein